MTLKLQRPLPKRQVALIVILSFFVIDELTSKFTWNIISTLTEDMSSIRRFLVMAPIQSIRLILLPILITAFIVGWRETRQSLGFHQSIWRGLGFAFLVCLPLPIAYGFTTPLADSNTMLVEILQYAVFFGTAEEILYRCFLFGLLFRLGGWGFLPAAMLGAVIFGIAHLYQGKTLSDFIGIFGITFIGGLWWAWIYVEWDYNAWVPIGLHVFVNGWFNVFEVSESALLPLAGEITRVFVVILSIVFTVAMRRKQGGLKIKGKLWFKSSVLEA